MYMVSTAQQFLLVELICMERHIMPKLCKAQVSKAASDAAQSFTVINGVSSLIVVGTLGALADRFGRKPVFTVAILGNIALCSLCVYTAKFKPAYWREILSTGNALQGLGGGAPSTFMCIFAFAADSSAPGERHLIFTLLEGMLGAGGALGSYLCGYLSEHLSTSSPFLCALSALVLMLLITCCMSETLSKENRTSALVLATSNTLGVLYGIVHPPASFLRSKQIKLRLAILLVAFCFHLYCILAYAMVGTIFLELIVGLPKNEIGIFLALSSGTRALAPFLLSPLAKVVSVNNSRKTAAVQAFIYSPLIVSCLLLVPMQSCHICREINPLVAMNSSFFPFIAQVFLVSYAIVVVPIAYIRSTPILYALSAGVGCATSAPAGFMRGMMSATVPADQQVCLSSIFTLPCQYLRPDRRSCCFLINPSAFPPP